MHAAIKYFFLAIVIIPFAKNSRGQAYPTFGPEISVSVAGLTFDAMEPFISVDGNTLFFNSLNSGGNTNLYHATRVNDSTFTFAGLVVGTYDTSFNHLDAVPSIDSLNNFFWTSLRGYPAVMENLHRGIYGSGAVSNITRVYGSFNIYGFNFPFGWLIMDAAVNYDGNMLYYTNSLFDFSNTICAGIPCESKIGVAVKVNDSTFNKHANSDAIFTHINDTLNYLIYAPQVTRDGLEIYFTRLLKGTFNTEICVSVRSSEPDTFSIPQVIHSGAGYFPEAASPTTNKALIYYHQKNSNGLYQIYMRYRNVNTSAGHIPDTGSVAPVFPNPAGHILHVPVTGDYTNLSTAVYSSSGKEIIKATNQTQIDISGLDGGIYFLSVKQYDKISWYRFMKY